jgi:hypothetical protein
VEDFVTQNALLGLLTAVVLQGLKKWPAFSWLVVPDGSGDKWNERKNLLVSILAAGLVQVGIHYTWHFEPTTGAFAFGLTGTVAGLKSGVWEWIQQWVAQHGAYKTVIVLPELLGKLNQTNSALLSYLETQTRPQAVRVQAEVKP